MGQLVPFDQNKYASVLALQDEGGMLAAVAESFGDNDALALGEHDLPRLEAKVIGKDAKWIVPDGKGSTTLVDEVECIILSMEPRGALWPYQEPGNSRPILVTHDLRVAYQIGDEMGDIDPNVIADMAIEDPDDAEGTAYDWTSTRDGGPNVYADWGTGKGARGKRVKESIRLLVLRPGSPLPAVINVPSTSFKAFKAFKVQCLDAQLPLFMVVTTIGLGVKPNVDGQEYAVMEPEVTGHVDVELLDKVRELRAKYASRKPCAADYQPRQSGQTGSPPPGWEPEDVLGDEE